MRAALDEGDHEAAIRQAHSTKGAGRGYGFERISTLGASIESALRSRDASAAREGIRQLEEHLERCRWEAAAD